jgi:hypothetical protein
MEESDELGPAVEVLDLDDLCSPLPPPRLSRQLTALADMNEMRGGTPPQPVNVLMIGSGELRSIISFSVVCNFLQYIMLGEYTTGYVHGQASTSDKSAGGINLLFDRVS